MRDHGGMWHDSWHSCLCSSRLLPPPEALPPAAQPHMVQLYYQPSSLAPQTLTFRCPKMRVDYLAPTIAVHIADRATAQNLELNHVVWLVSNAGSSTFPTSSLAGLAADITVKAPPGTEPPTPQAGHPLFVKVSASISAKYRSNSMCAGALFSTC